MGPQRFGKIVLLVFIPFASSVFAQAGAGQKLPAELAKYPKLLNSKPFQRWWESFRLRAAGLKSEILPAQARTAAVQTANAYQVIKNNTSVSGIPGSRWQLLGPRPETGGQIGATIGAQSVSGRITTLAVVPSHSNFPNPNYWLMGAAQGGVWATFTAGGSWVARTDATASLAMGAVAFAPSKPNIIYVGTGEGNFAGDAYAGQGLLKSNSNGATWVLLGAQYFAGASFTNLKVSPTDPNTLVATTVLGIAGKIPTISSVVPLTGVYKSTDGGNTFSLNLTGGPSNLGATDLVVDPTNWNNQFAGMGDIFGAAGNGLFRSTDGGTTWNQVAGPWDSMEAGVGRIALAIAPTDRNTMYIGIQDAFNGVGTDGGLLGLWVTSDAWDATPVWTSIDVAPTDDGSGTHGYCGWDEAFGAASDQCWYDNVLAVDPTDSGILYAGGIPLWEYNSHTTTWTEISQQVSNPTGGIHSDQHALAFDGTTLIVGNDGGVWSSADRGSTWADLNTFQSTIQFYNGSLSPATVNLMLGGSQDNGTSTFTGGLAWPLIAGGDGAANAISHANPSTNWAVSSEFLNILKTTNSGASFNPATSGIDFTNVPFIAQFKECPQNENVFIAGTQDLFKSTNFFTATPTWTNNSFGVIGVHFPGGIQAMAFGPSNTPCNIYAFGSAAGDLWLTGNAGGHWTNINTAGGPLPARPVTSVVFHPTNPNILYVTYSGFNAADPTHPGHIFMTTNALTATPTWTDVSPPVDIPHNAIAIDPTNPQIIYVGTDVGIWKSTNGGTSWTQMGPGNSGLPNVAVFDLQVAGAHIAAFTHGRGAFLLQTFDLNGDGVVSCADLQFVQAHYGSYCGQANYNNIADLNNDCFIDIKDVTLMSQNLPPGSSCGP
jgi:hypothetical protein